MKSKGKVKVNMSARKYRMTPYLEGVLKEARIEYKAGKTRKFDNAKDFIAALES